MSQRELKRAGILERVAGGELRLVEGSELMGLSYRQGKRLWKRYREKGPAGLEHGNVGRVSNRAKPRKFRRRVLKLVREKYSGGEEERFGQTVAAEHLGEEDGLEVRPSGDGCSRRGCGVGRGSGRGIGGGGGARSTLGSWCNWMGAFMSGWKGEDRGAA